MGNHKEFNLAASVDAPTRVSSCWLRLGRRATEQHWLIMRLAILLVLAGFFAGCTTPPQPHKTPAQAAVTEPIPCASPPEAGPLSRSILGLGVTSA